MRRCPANGSIVAGNGDARLVPVKQRCAIGLRTLDKADVQRCDKVAHALGPFPLGRILRRRPHAGPRHKQADDVSRPEGIDAERRSE